MAMQPVIEWLKHNKEWVFSGAGLVISGWILSWLRSRHAPARAPASLQINLAFGLLAHGPKLSDQMLLSTVANPSDRPSIEAGERHRCWHFSVKLTDHNTRAHQSGSPTGRDIFAANGPDVPDCRN
jgi:hypothetical protein